MALVRFVSVALLYLPVELVCLGSVASSLPDRLVPVWDLSTRTGLDLWPRPCLVAWVPLPVQMPTANPVPRLPPDPRLVPRFLPRAKRPGRQHGIRPSGKRLKVEWAGKAILQQGRMSARHGVAGRPAADRAGETRKDDSDTRMRAIVVDVLRDMVTLLDGQLSRGAGHRDLAASPVAPDIAMDRSVPHDCETESYARWLTLPAALRACRLKKYAAHSRASVDRGYGLDLSAHPPTAFSSFEDFRASTTITVPVAIFGANWQSNELKDV
jgi:hypothetical protein